MNDIAKALDRFTEQLDALTQENAWLRERFAEYIQLRHPCDCDPCDECAMLRILTNGINPQPPQPQRKAPPQSPGDLDR